MDQWKEIPVYKSTNKISPGEKVGNATSNSTLGLFLEADGMSEFEINMHGIHLHHRQDSEWRTAFIRFIHSFSYLAFLIRIKQTCRQCYWDKSITKKSEISKFKRIEIDRS